jgi:phosphoglycerate-specific signal transduction histidine kinase
LTLLETNISFFKHAKDDNPMLVDVRKNIEKQKEKLITIQSRMAFVKSL